MMLRWGGVSQGRCVGGGVSLGRCGAGWEGQIS